METIKGAYTSAQIFTTNNKETAVDPYAISQLQMICNQESSRGCRIRVMPDVHPGKVGTIGLTMTIGEKIIPNLIGMKREEVKNRYTVSSFKSEMKGIYSSCIGKDTLDEAPFAYRSLEDITDVIGETVTIDRVIRPVYNFKAGDN